MTERAELFRTQAVIHKSDRLRSAPLIHQRQLQKILFWLLQLLLVVVLLLLGLTDYRETVSARGILEPDSGTQKLVSPVAAILTEIFVTEGDPVEAGQVLASLSSTLFDQSGHSLHDSEIASLRSALALLKQEQGIHQKMYVSNREAQLAAISSAKASEEIVSEEVVLITSQVAISEQHLGSLRTLLQNSDLPQVEFDRYQTAHLDFLLQQQQTKERQNQLSAQSHNLALGIDFSDLDFQNKRLQLQKEIEQLEFSIDQMIRQQGLTVVAGQAGIVAAITAKPGQSVLSNQPLFYINPGDRNLEAIIYVPSKIMGTLVPGQEILLSFDAFNYESYGRYSATLQRIDRASLDPREHLLPVANAGEPVFRLVARLSQAYVEGPEVYPLQSGMQLSADFVVSEMSLLAYAFRPLLQLRKKAQ